MSIMAGACATGVCSLVTGMGTSSMAILEVAVMGMCMGMPVLVVPVLTGKGMGTPVLVVVLVVPRCHALHLCRLTCHWVRVGVGVGVRVRVRVRVKFRVKVWVELGLAAP